MRHRLVGLFVVLSVLAGASPAAARTTPLRGTPPEELLARVRSEGRLAVIVRVRLEETWVSEPRLPEGKREIQRQAVRRRKELVFGRHSSIKPRDFRYIPSFVTTVDERALRRLLADDDVDSIRENRKVELALAQSVPRIGGNVAWNLGYTGAGQVVAVVDTGVERNHPFLSGRIVHEACFTSALGGSEPSCPDGVQQPDGTVRTYGQGSAAPCAHNGVLAEGCVHGTRVTGIAAGRDPGSEGFSGVAKDASIIAINVASVRPCTTCETGWKNDINESDVIDALEYLYSIRGNYALAAVNLSLYIRASGAGNQTCDAAAGADDWANVIDLLHDSGVAVVAGSGNSSSATVADPPGQPACIAKAIAVGATTDDQNPDAVAPYSNSGAALDLLAPGGLDGIPGRGILTSNPGGGYAEEAGTSFAAPHISGAIAILRQKSPFASVDTLLGYLQATGVPVSDARQWAAPSRPRIDIGAAVAAADGSPPTTPGSFMATATTTSSVTLDWFASSDDVGVVTYVIERKNVHTASWQEIGRTASLTFTDSGLNANATCVYRVRALDAAQNASSPAIDYATTVLFEDDPIQEPWETGGTSVRGIHIGRLRQAIDAWRVHSGLATLYTYAPESGFIEAADLTNTVTALNAARAALALSPFSYPPGTTPAPGVFVDDDHVQQLRNALK